MMVMVINHFYGNSRFSSSTGGNSNCLLASDSFQSLSRNGGITQVIDNHLFFCFLVVVDNTIVHDIVKVIANDVRVKSHRPSLLMSSSSSYYVIAINAIRMTLGMFTRPLIVVPDDIFVDVVVFVIVVVFVLLMYIFRMTLGMFTRPLIAVPVVAAVTMVIFLSH